jgi:hypothetical protein
VPFSEPPLEPDGERDDRDGAYEQTTEAFGGEQAAESFAGKDLDELQDEFEDEDARQSER